MKRLLLLVFILVLSLSTCGTTYVLVSGYSVQKQLTVPVPAPTNIGVLYNGPATANQGGSMFKLSNGHIYMAIGINDDNPSPESQMWIIRLDVSPPTYQIVSFPTGDNPPNVWTVGAVSNFCLGPDDMLYIRVGSYDAVAYDPDSGGTSYTHILRSGGPCTLITNGDDGKIYIGTQSSQTTAHVFKYTIGGSVEDLGSVEKTGTSAYHVDSIGVYDNNRYVFVAVRTTDNYSYLCVIDTQNSNSKTYYFDGQSDYMNNPVFATTGNTWSYQRTKVDNSVVYYALGESDGSVTLLGSPPTGESCRHRTQNACNVVGIGNSEAETPGCINSTGIEFDFYEYTKPVTSKIKFRNVGDETWTEVSTTNIAQVDQPIDRIVDLDGGANILICPRTYGYVNNLARPSNISTILGYSGQSIYDTVKAPSDAYLTGYPTVMARYHAASPWTQDRNNINWNGFDPTDEGKTNPYYGKNRVTGSSYYYYLDYDINGLIWCTFVGRYSDADIQGVVWWSPVTGAWDKYNTASPDKLLRSLCGVGDRSKMAGGCYDDTMLIWNASDKTLYRTVNNPSGTTGYGRTVVASLPGGDIMGISINLSDETITKAWRYNIAGDSFPWRVTLPSGAAFGGVTSDARRLRIGPDGNGYIFVGDHLYQIAASDGTATKVLDTGAGILSIIGNDGHLYKAVDGSSDYRIIEGMFH